MPCGRFGGYVPPLGPALGKEGIVATPHWLIPVRGHNSDKTKKNI